jgi:hypothetical protein
MTADEFERVGKTFVYDNIMKQNNLTEEQKMEYAQKKLKEIVDKQVSELNAKKVDSYEDKVQFGRNGWKERYYYEKFDILGPEALLKFRREIRQSYIEGLAWVFAYYYRGCVSWHWYYPYHYAPFSSDLLGCDSLEINFELGEPVTPFEQLLSVFPKQSAHAIPSCYHKLYAPESAIIDFYPSEVKLDINGARYAWMGVNLLSFIERPRLTAAMWEADGEGSKLTAREKERNRRFGDVKLFFRETIYTKKSALVKALLRNPGPEYVLEAKFASQDAIAGQVSLPAPGPEKQQAPSHGQRVDKQVGRLEVSLEKCECHIVHFAHPKYEEHSSHLLEGAIMPRREVEDFAIFHTKRRVFQGEEAIRIVERVLKIDASADPVYSFGGRTNFSGQQIGGYRNGQSFNSESGVARGGFQAMPQIGARRSYQEYRSLYHEEGGDDQQAHKRRNNGGAEHGQGRPGESNVSYNLTYGREGVISGPQNPAGPTAARIRENYERQIAEANQ